MEQPILQHSWFFHLLAPTFWFTLFWPPLSLKILKDDHLFLFYFLGGSQPSGSLAFSPFRVFSGSFRISPTTSFRHLAGGSEGSRRGQSARRPAAKRFGAGKAMPSRSRERSRSRRERYERRSSERGWDEGDSGRTHVAVGQKYVPTMAQALVNGHLDDSINLRSISWWFDFDPHPCV